MIEKLGRYEILEKIGAGGFAIVYRARDTELDRLVALKELHPALLNEAQGIADFKREARTIARLDHPHIVTIFDVIEIANRFFIAMRLVAGDSLDALIARQGGCGWTQTLTILGAVAEALDYAHAQNILHRDIKPANILLDQERGPQLSDFGLAKLVTEASSHITPAGGVGGTPQYIAPEVWEGRGSTAQSDIYALGCVLYELLIGSPLFRRDSLPAVISAHFEPPVLPDHWPEGIPPAVKDVLQTALAAQAQERYATARDLVTALNRLKYNEGGQATSLSDIGSEKAGWLEKPPQSSTVIKPASAVVASEKSTPPKPTQFSLSAQSRKTQDILLHKVKAFWIKGVLEQSLYSEAAIALGKETRPDAVAYPWTMVVQQPDQPHQPITPDKSIFDIFDEAGQALLILGAPGAGKTTLLLDLAKTAIARAEQDTTQPIPVVFNLASWRSRMQSLEDWLVQELNEKYLIPKRVAQQWVLNDQLLLLLDGLDEARPERRISCIVAINHFRQSHGLGQMVVCSRLEVYEALGEKLRLENAIVLQPLTLPQIRDYLTSGGPKLEAIYQMLEQDETLQTLARSPLMLTLIILAYQDAPESPTPFQSLTVQRNHLFNTYVEQMFRRRGFTDQATAKNPQNGRYTTSQIQHWLSCLAQGLEAHDERIFLIERLQPSWLTTKTQRWAYNTVTKVMIYLVVASLFAFALADGVVEQSFEQILGIALWSGLVIGLANGVINSLQQQWLLPTKHSQWVFQRRQAHIRLLLLCVSILVTGATLFFFIAVAPASGYVVAANLAAFSLFLAFRDRGRSAQNEIQMTDAISWSWSTAARSALLGTALVSGIWVLEWLQKPNYNPFGIDEMLSFLIIELIFVILMGLIGGIHRTRVTTESAPNQGIHSSIRNAVLAGVSVFGIIGGFFVGLYLLGNVVTTASVWLTTEAIGISLKIGSAFGITVGLLFGGIEAISHGVLRLFLWRSGQMPLRLKPWLDQATNLIFLRRVGGGYLFVHRLLQMHFAQLGDQE